MCHLDNKNVPSPVPVAERGSFGLHCGAAQADLHGVAGDVGVEAAEVSEAYHHQNDYSCLQ